MRRRFRSWSDGREARTSRAWPARSRPPRRFERKGRSCSGDARSNGRPVSRLDLTIALDALLRHFNWRPKLSALTNKIDPQPLVQSRPRGARGALGKALQTSLPVFPVVDLRVPIAILIFLSFSYKT